MNKNKVVISFSGGKDSMLSLYKAMKQEYEVIGLIVTFGDNNNSCFHKIPNHIFEQLSEALNIPIFKVNCESGKIYEEEFENTLRQVKNLGAEICVFGDIDIDHHRKWCTDRCTNANINPYFPLWQQNREDIVNEFIECGFEAVIKKVNLEYLPESFLGRTLNKETIDEIKNLNCDACGENGEYHTLVINGPIFKKPIEINILGKEIIEHYGYLRVS